MSRHLTTQQRVDLAVKAGHYALVKDYIQMHNNGEGSEDQSLTVVGPLGVKDVFFNLPSYAFAAVDCYLTAYDIPLYAECEEEPTPTPTEQVGRGLARYALKAAEDAKRYRANTERPIEIKDRIAYILEYEAIDTAFAVLSEVVKRNTQDKHGMQLVSDAEHNTETLILDSGSRIERSHDCEAESPLDHIYSLTNAKGESEELSQAIADELLTQIDDLLMIGDLDFGGPDARNY